MEKKKILIFGISILILPVVLFQCTDQHLDCDACDGDVEVFAMQKLPSVLENFQIAGTDLPSGTMVEYITPRIIELTYPDGYHFVGMNSEDGYMMSNQSQYSCSCTGEGCNVVAVPSSEPGQSWDVACSSCTEDCTGKWVDNNDLEINENSGFINLEDGVSFIKTTTECTIGPNANSFFEIDEMRQGLNDFLNQNELSLWDGTSDDFIMIPIRVFGSPIVLKFHSDTPGLLSNNINPSSDVNNYVMLSNDTPTCNCSSGASGCDYEEITYKPCSWCPEVSIGHQCTAGDCVTCVMDLPEEEEPGG
jgi:hypothetical protein